MHYEGNIYRPPSEAHSLLVQVTIGCAWNRCTFCTMYKDKKFRVRDLADIDKDLVEGSSYARQIRRIFLCDGDALALSQDKLVHILSRIQALYPGLESVRSYASARDVRAKSPAQLAELRSLGLDMVYLGLESGSDEVLKAVNKGDDAASMIAAAELLHGAGIKQSISIIAGFGDEDQWPAFVRDTAKVLNAMQPEYVGLLTLRPPSEDGYEDLTEGFKLGWPSQLRILREMRLLVENLELSDCLFTSAHASNFNHFRAHLPEEKQRLLGVIDDSIRRLEDGTVPPAPRYRGL